MGCTISADRQVGSHRDRRKETSARLGRGRCLLSPDPNSLEHYRCTTFFLESESDGEDVAAREGDATPTTAVEISPSTTAQTFTPGASYLAAPVLPGATSESADGGDSKTLPDEGLASVPSRRPAQLSMASLTLSPGGGGSESITSAEFRAAAAAAAATATGSACSPRSPASPSWSPRSPSTRRVQLISRDCGCTPRSALKRSSAAGSPTGTGATQQSQQQQQQPQVVDDDGCSSECPSGSDFASSSHFGSGSMMRRRVTFTWADDAVEAALRGCCATVRSTSPSLSGGGGGSAGVSASGNGSASSSVNDANPPLELQLGVQ